MLFASHLHVMLTRIQIWNLRSYVCSDVRSTVAQQQLPLSLRSLLFVQVDPKRNLVMKVLIKSMSAAVERITTPFALIV